MQDPRLNIQPHEWYAKVRHVRIPRIAESKKYLDYAYTGGGGGGVTPVETFNWLWEVGDTVTWETGDRAKLEPAT